ncbi:MAG: thymidine phosphorylase [Eubacteriales bacterium]|nr:thymidine phosphorylase [Christensenellaceae bacterium]MDY2751731.1 thymidine phosphorylase [Eubacteriales bacterium]
MRAYDVIKKKRDGYPLSDEEIRFFVKGYTEGSIPDYQAAAFLMAVYFRGMNASETVAFTREIADSGDKVDLSGIKGFKADKHSTGGVGDKTTLIVAPVVASCGVKVAKMSGRGLGHTGGTVDKLEAIPGYRTTLSREEFFGVVNAVGCSVIGQSGELAPADKKFYALRDVTATVDKRPLIAASIMGKKLASGSDGIVLDVKVGSGAFNKTFDEGLALAKTMVNIGNKAGKITRAVISNMDKPLGYAVGNAIEVREAAEILQKGGDDELTELCLELAANMLCIAGFGSLENCRKTAGRKLKSGDAFETFAKMVAAHGGDVSYVENPEKLVLGKFSRDVTGDENGYIIGMNCEGYGLASLALGAGRNKKDDVIDPGAGIVVRKKTGDYVNKNDVVATLFSSSEEKLDAAEKILKSALKTGDNPPPYVPIILGRVK